VLDVPYLRGQGSPDRVAVAITLPKASTADQLASVTTSKRLASAAQEGARWNSDQRRETQDRFGHPRRGGELAAEAQEETARAIEMRAAVLREPGRPVSVETVHLQPPRRGEVLVRVAAAGVCHSDVHLADGLLGEGRWPMVLGHEGAGVVEAVGEDVTEVSPGDHVAFCFVPSCGACRACRGGHRTLCETAGANGVAGMLMDGTSRLRALDGSVLQHGLMVACFAAYAVVPAAGAVPLPQSIPLWQAALLGCGVVTGIGAVNRAGLRVGASVCVIGCGGVGLQVIAGARLAGAGTIVAVDIDDAKLELARRRGATHAVGPAGGAVVEQVLAITDGVEHAFEVVGSAATIRQSWDVLRPGGTAIVVGVSPQGVEASLPAIDFLSEKTITGSYYGSTDVHAALGQLMQLVVDGRLNLEDVVSRLINLDEVEAALERLRRGQEARSVIVIDEALAGVTP
jgi:S-(hydroxymethyl)glutathione dehydrogenase / alcohol dehydrogenase